jgi:hypothetical protein
MFQDAVTSNLVRLERNLEITAGRYFLLSVVLRDVERASR